MKPSISFFSSTGRLPTEARKRCTRATGPSAEAGSAVVAAGQSSTSGTRCAGPMKCAAMVLAAPAPWQPWAMAVTEREEVLVQSTAPAPVRASSWPKSARLASRSSAMLSKTNSASRSASSREVVVVSRPCAGEARPFFARKATSSPTCSAARARPSGDLPQSRTSCGPPARRQAAMPRPIMPGPTTATTTLPAMARAGGKTLSAGRA
mmetsp:Transcript_88083/g.285086  ORF Transcript_88083/g.285086 Transcript_88083/m.285086 type:complete len:208 (+) Transcript_88083:507-1130(+)